MKQYKKFFTGPRKLLLALSVLLCVWFGTAYGASAAGGDYTENEISMDVVCGYDGHVKGGRYLPVQVILTNGQETDSAGQIRSKLWNRIMTFTSTIIRWRCRREKG